MHKNFTENFTEVFKVFKTMNKTRTYDTCINSILLAVIYLTKLQNLINRPVMNCSMSIFPYFYFSNYILFDFPSSGLIFL